MRPGVLGVAFVAVSAVLVIGGIVTPAIASSNPDDARAKILADTNALRAQNGLPPLVDNPAIDVVAQNWANQLSASGQPFAHNPSFFNQMPTGATSGGENIAGGFSYEVVVTQGWAKSPGHLGNMLGTYTDIGIGYYVSADGNTIYAVQDFGYYPSHGGTTAPSSNPAPSSSPTPTADPTPTPTGASAPSVPVAAPPLGAVTTVQPLARSIRLMGWAVDPNTPTEAVTVDVQTSAGWSTVIANSVTPDAGSQAGAGHGFDTTLPVSPGSVTVCVYPRNTGPGGASSLGCRVVVVPAGYAPVGALQSVTTDEAGVQIAGWAVDADDKAEPVKLDLQLDSTWMSATADQPGATTQVADSGSVHGFSAHIPASSGSHTLCVYMRGIGAGGDGTLGCRTALVRNAPPIGALTSAINVGDGVMLSGELRDPDHPSTPLTIDVQTPVGWKLAVTDGKQGTFTIRLPLPQGWQTFCLYPRDATTGANSSLGCSRVLIDSSPVGMVATIADTPTGLRIGGWAIDPDSLNTSVVLDVQLGGVWQVVEADEVAAASARFPAAGDAHGFDAVLRGPSGLQWLCVYARNVGAGSTASLGCWLVGVP